MTLTEQEQAQVERRVRNSGKSVGLAYFLWLLAGIIGVHRFYNKQTRRGLITLALCITALAALAIPVHTQMPEYTQCVHNSVRSFSPTNDTTCTPPVDTLSAAGRASMLLGAALLIVILLWWIVDAFLIPRATRQNNQTLRLRFQDEILKQRPPQE